MLSHLLNHFSLQAAKWNGLVLVALLFIWACVVACVISSIVTQPFDRRQRIAWIALVILLPFLGVLSYLPFAFRKEDLPHIFIRKKKRPRKDKVHESGVES